LLIAFILHRYSRINAQAIYEEKYVTETDPLVAESWNSGRHEIWLINALGFTYSQWDCGIHGRFVLKEYAGANGLRADPSYYKHL